MEHLPPPTGVSLGPRESVPFLGCRYDEDGPLLEYHTKTLSKTDNLEGFVTRAIESPIFPPALVALYQTRIHVPENRLQAWLFFGLLKEFFPDSEVVEEFVTVGGETTVLSTATLVKRVDQWVSDRTVSTDDEELRRLYKCVTFISPALMVLWRTDYDEAGKLCIASVAELLHNAILKVASPALGFVSLAWVMFWDIKVVLDRLRHSGWCEYEASQVPKRATSLYTRFYYTCLDRHSSGRDHSTCDALECRALSIQVAWQEIYGTSHVSSCHECKEIEIDEEMQKKIDESLKSGQFPLYRIRGTGEGAFVDASRYTGDEKFVAISHVFADGLGNEERNAMNRCQLLRLNNLIRSLWTEELANDREDNAWFWIDTFGCPRKDLTARAAAIRMLRETFRKATHVLVLDAELQRKPCAQMSELEMSARGLNSGWMHRMWTLPEGTLPKSVWIQFADRAKNVWEHLISPIQTIYMSGSLRYRCLARDVIGQFQALRRLGGDYEMLQIELYLICWAFEFRLTTKRTDEPLCVAMLVDLDIKALNRIPGEMERKQLMWKLLSQRHIIPKTIVFHDQPTLPFWGFQWAPVSLNPPGLANILVNPAANQSELRWNTTPRGLHVSFPGSKIRLLPESKIDVDRLRYLRGQPLDILLIRLTSARWIYLSRSGQPLPDQTLYREVLSSKLDLAVFRDSSNVSLGLMSRVMEEDDATLIVKRAFNVLVTDHITNWNEMLEHVLQKAKHLLSSRTVQCIIELETSTDLEERREDTSGGVVDALSNTDESTLGSLYSVLNDAIEVAGREIFAIYDVSEPPESTLTEVCAAISTLLVEKYGTIEDVAPDGSLPERKWCIV